MTIRISFDQPTKEEGFAEGGYFHPAGVAIEYVGNGEYTLRPTYSDGRIASHGTIIPRNAIPALIRALEDVCGDAA
ncbi:hypothetical protein [Inquilinus limosus]|uniref:Uncharacterized protein n=1 Tax=Inquilinus limosus MP06 TaxID=1398085 RepID=A0A0A0DDE8_9PROT|nr:hypothetical protein [Inquilinus limosus]KGM36149.1 hypothetical protein P409_00440 [Inquilinus limosus MP06]